MQSAVGAPIVVDAHLWGALLVGSVQAEPLPPDTELQIEEFAALVAMPSRPVRVARVLAGLAWSSFAAVQVGGP